MLDAGCWDRIRACIAYARIQEHHNTISFELCGGWGRRTECMHHAIPRKMEPKEMNGSSEGALSAQRQDGGCPTSETQDQHQLRQQQPEPETSANVMPSAAAAAAASRSSVGSPDAPNQSPTSPRGESDETSAGGITIGRTSSPLMATDTPERTSTSKHKHGQKSSGSSSRDSRRPNATGRYSSSAAEAHQQQHSASSRLLPPRSPPVLSNQEPHGEEEEDPRIPAAELSERLEEASIELVDNLFRFVNSCRRDQEGRGGDNTASAQPRNNRQQRSKMGQVQQPKKRKMGLTLPASAIGWLSSRMDPQVGDEDANYHGRITRGSSSRRRTRNNGGGGGSGSRHRGSTSGRRQSPSDSMQLSERLALLQFHLPQYVEHLQITNEEWPPPPPVVENEGRRSSSDSSTLVTNRQAGQQSGRASALNRLYSPRIKGSATPGTPETQSPRKRNVLAGYCIAAALSREEPRGEGDDAQRSRSVEGMLLSQYARSPQKQAAIRFLLYWQRLQNHPRVDLVLFANVRALILEGVLPEWIDNMSVVRGGLEVFRVERACVFDMPSFLLSTKMSSSGGSVSTHAGTHRVANAGEGPSEQDEKTLLVSTVGKESTLSHVTNLDLNRFDSANTNEVHAGESDSDSNDCYASLTRLKLSHCAIGECYASDEDRVTGDPLSRMPKLESLSLSHNEISRPTTACAGLKNLPQLCALDFSFNRIQSMRNAFIMLGNIRTLVLSWNQISSVEGLDRMYSLERLAIDHNNIQYLQDAAGLANLPDLMHLEMKGNPIETNDSRFRVNLLNLFKERRLKLLPRGATYRQLQELLPVLDGKVVSSVELVGLKEMTFAPLVQPLTSATNQSPDPNREQGSPSESNAATIPPMTHADFTVLSPQNGERGRSSLTFAPSPRRIRRRVQTRQANIRSILLPPDAAPSDQKITAQQTSKEKRVKLSRKQHSNTFSVGDIISALVPRSNIPDELESENEEEPFVDAESIIDEGSESTSSGSDGEADEDSFMSATSHVDDIEPEIGLETNQRAASPHEASTNAPAGTQKASKREGNVPLAEKSSLDKEEAIKYGPDTIAGDVAFPDLLGDTDEDGRKEAGKNAVILDSSQSPDGKVAREQIKERKPFDFGLAEKTSVYDGKDSYSKLSVQSYLQLYFQIFVFPPALSKGASFYEGEDSQESVEQDLYLPRIQLFHSDRELAMKSPETGSTSISSSPGVATPMREKFIDVWTDEIMACGLAATSRLPPVSKSLRGFHGEVIRNRGVDELASESQLVLLCLTDAALYFISDFGDDDENNGGRRFPRPLPRNTTFGDALWPHALARHPLDYLQRITIGFQFQRLVLHFVLPKRDGQTQGYEYAYVVFTCNKLRTISLVQKLQAQKKTFVEQRAKGSDFGTDKDPAPMDEELIIENDDRVVLDSLADAIAPAPMGVVLHYQVLRQKWRSKRPDGTDPVVRRVCVLTDASIFLLDENYVGDGSTTTLTQSGKYGDATLRLVDSAELTQVTEIRPADEDPTHITLVIQKSRLVRSHRWRLVCKDGESAERLVHDVRQAVAAL